MKKIVYPRNIDTELYFLLDRCIRLSMTLSLGYVLNVAWNHN